MTEAVGLLAGPGSAAGSASTGHHRGYQYGHGHGHAHGHGARSAWSATGQSIGSAIPGPRSAAGQGNGSGNGREKEKEKEKEQGDEAAYYRGAASGVSTTRSAARRSTLLGGRHYTLSSTGGATGGSSTKGAVTSSTSPGATAARPKTRLPVSTTGSAAPESPSATRPAASAASAASPSLPSPLLHRQPRSYLRTRASSLAASATASASASPPSNVDTPGAALDRPPSQASSSLAASPPVTRSRPHPHQQHTRPRRASDDSAVSVASSGPNSPPPGSSPPSSVGQDIQAQRPCSASHDKPLFSSTTTTSSSFRRRPRSSSFDLPAAARPRPRAYSDQGPRPDFVSRPPQTFYLRRASNPEPQVGRDSYTTPEALTPSPSSTHSSLYSRAPRAPASFSSKGISTSTGPPPSINGRLLQLAGDDANLDGLEQEHQTQHHHLYQPRYISSTRELLPLKTAATSLPPDETRRRSVHASSHSYRLSLSGSLPANATPVRVPPIRSFRSSGSRKSLHALDMNFTPRPYDLSESTGAPLYDENPARAATAAPDAHARFDRHSRLMTPPVSGRQGANGDESGDVFLRLAREDALNRTTNGRTPDGTYSPVSATHRSWHRRPFSTHVASYQPLSPPKLRRRLSDQQERPVLGNPDDDQTSQASRVLQYRAMGRDKAASAHPAEAATQFAPPTRAHRPPPLSSRSPVYHDNSDNYRHTRRRSSVTDSTPPISGRPQSYKAGAVYNYSKSYSSSPLVRTFDLPPPQGQDGQIVEGTESTTSTTAPSTVWDELDELKSRINRLEITGKLPSTSGATVSKLEERPVTANTTVTTASVSPKRQVHITTDDTASSTTQSAYPILQTALANCKLNLSPEVFQALDCVAQDALGLSAAMGHAAIPSGASTIGTGSNASDRQLRRKAESVCRSLGELCIALNDDATYRAGTTQPHTNQPYASVPATPTLPKSHSGGLPSRRSSVVESPIPLSHTSPRLMSRFEERRNSLLHGAGPPVSLHSNPNNANDTGLNRHSSLYVSRTRQPRQDEPEDGRESALSRSRRAMTEEPEERPRSGYLVRSRRGTAEDSHGQPLSRSPTRRAVDLAQYEPATHDQAIEADAPDRQDTSSVVSSATSRRRMASEIHASRLAGPATGSSPAPTRKYLERSVSTREGAGTPILDRLSRNFSMHSRTGSQHRVTPATMLPRPPSGNAASEGSQ